MSNNRISALRHEYGMNQRELGLKLGVGQTTVSAWEKGKNEPDQTTLHKMAQLFRCSIGYLTGYEDSEGNRGLTQEQIQAYQGQDTMDRAIGRMEQDDLLPEEVDDLLEAEERHKYADWLETHPNVFFEAYEFNQICERISAAQRKRLLQIAELFEEGIRE